MKHLALTLALLLCAPAHANRLLDTHDAAFTSFSTFQPPASSDPTIPFIPADRDNFANWSMAGLLSVGGIPAHTTQCGSTLTPVGGASDDTAQIQSAINACSVTVCPSGKYVLLGAGTFRIQLAGTPIRLNKCVDLVGSGPGVTILHSPNGAVLNSVNPGVHSASIATLGGSGAITQTTNLASDGAQGSYSIQVASATGFAIGGVVLVDELANGQAMPDCCFNSSTSSVIASATNSSIAGTTLSLGTVTGTPVAGMIVTGPGVAYATSLVSGSGTSWQITPSQTVAGPISVSFGSSVWAEPDYRVMWNQHVPTVIFYDSACIGYANNNNWAASCATNGDECAYSVRCGGVNEELHVISGVAGTTITFDSPLTLSYRTARTAQAHLYPAASMVTYAGIENLTVSNGDFGNVVFQACQYCWAFNVESTVWLNAGAFAFYNAAFRNQVERSWLHDAAWPVNGGGGYALNETFGASENLFWNNIDMLANKVEVHRASGAGTVVAYNYMDDGYINGQDTWVETGLNCSHLAGSHSVLHEGNQSWNSDNDVTHGSVGHCAFFRNWLTGFRAPFTALDGTSVNDATNTPSGVGPLRALGDHFMSYWDSFVGNLVGTSGAVGSWTLRCAAGNADLGCAPALYNLGWNDTSVSGSLADATMALSYSASPSSTLTGPGCLTASNCTPVVEGNYDYKSNAVQWNVASSHVLPASWFLSATPLFFSAPGGSATYPYPWTDTTSGTPLKTNSLGGSALPAKARWDASTPFVQP